MNSFQFIGLFLLHGCFSCTSPTEKSPSGYTAESITQGVAMDPSGILYGDALLLTDFQTLTELEKVIQIQFYTGSPASPRTIRKNPMVQLTYKNRDRQVISELKTGISESDFLRAKNGTFWDKMRVAWLSPFSLIHRNDLVSIEFLGRRKYHLFGEGDPAFYDLADSMVSNIVIEDTLRMSADELGEKGYLNTFNHIIAQAFMTSLFSEDIADFVSDVHERHTMPALITGQFTAAQLQDWKDGPVDNYLDMINNEWGQELGKFLRAKYGIHKDMNWSPALLADYLNDIQAYHSAALQIGFRPFKVHDEIVIRFAEKVNRVLKEKTNLEEMY